MGLHWGTHGRSRDGAVSPFVGYHAAHPLARNSILREGLVCGKLTGRVVARPPDPHPWGVFVFNDDYENPTGWMGKWAKGPTQDLWSVSYIGPMCPDPLLRNAVILLADRVTTVTLVTGNMV